MQYQMLCGRFLPSVVPEQLLYEANGHRYFQGLDVLCYADAVAPPKLQRCR